MNEQKIKSELYSKIESKIAMLYPDTAQLTSDIVTLIEASKLKKRGDTDSKALDQKSVYLITYGDSFSLDGKSKLTALHQFSSNFIQDIISDIHLLPMFPYTSDDGFSVVDYYQIDPELGSWKEIGDLSESFSLMFDCVINHISKESHWFQGYLNGDEKYQNFFINKHDNVDYSKVIRPRALPLFSPFVKSSGEAVEVWTTFSDDQIDINFREPEVLLESIKILLYYAANGATSIRLDAIGFIWKELDSTCIHLPQVHQIIQLWRLILDELYPNCRLITETNVPHQENVSYFGEGNEAQMVYQFPLPPLTLHAFLRGDAQWLRGWASALGKESFPENVTFFNFLASHDGIGLRSTEGILDDNERQFMVDETLRKQGYVSWKNNSDGSRSPYELNINYLSALSEPGDSHIEKISKITAAHSILFALQGVPAIYYHSLLGSENDQEAVVQSGINRRINRNKLDLLTLEKELENPTSLRYGVFNRLSQLLKLRQQHSAFSPDATQTILDLDYVFFGIKRSHLIDKEQITCVVNVTPKEQLLSLNCKGIDIISNEPFNGRYLMAGFQVLWIKESNIKGAI